MLQLENFVAWISVDDHPLQEYDVQYTEDLLTAVCWIASEDDKVRPLPSWVFFNDKLAIYNQLARLRQVTSQHGTYLC
jgi:hypothetical protein